jgi:hypothetical protein
MTTPTEPIPPGGKYGQYPCPCCGHRLDVQGVELRHRTRYDCLCYGCGAHVTVRPRP